MGTADLILQSVSIIFAATFVSSSEANLFAWDLPGILRVRKTPQVVAAIASLPTGKESASKMLFIGIYLTLFLPDGTTLPLLAAAIRQFGSDPDVCQAVQVNSSSPSQLAVSWTSRTMRRSRRCY
jgi:hypothetical protein